MPVKGGHSPRENRKDIPGSGNVLKKTERELTFSWPQTPEA